jgi:hephaestin
VPAAASPAKLLAALYNAAASSPTNTVTPIPAEISDSHPAILNAILAALPAGLIPGKAVQLPASLLGVSLGSAGATLLPVGAGSSFNLLNASAFAAAHGQVALEAAVAPLALEALKAEPAFKADEFEESNTMHGLNGLLYCNKAALPGAELPTAPLGANTRWYVAVLGTEVDLHAAHWHGNTVLERQSAGGAYRSDSIALLPRQIATADMVAHAAGRWLFHCHVTDHIEAGMLALYEAAAPAGGSASQWLPVLPPGSAPLPLPPPALEAQLRGGRLREYFIQAEPGNWSYLRGPVGPAAPDSAAKDGAASAAPCGTLSYEALDERHNGSFAWSKVRFVRYTDASFTIPWVHPTAEEGARWKHLSLLGPVLRGEVGDTLRVWFRNAAPQPFSLHPHGVVYAKGSEGAPYSDSTTDPHDKGDDKVAPGETWPHTWFLPEGSGPGPNDPSSIPWLYHGHVHEAGDENTGLVGVLLVTGRGKARVPGSAVEADLRPADVDRELVVMAKVFSETGASEEVHKHGRLRPVPAPGSAAAADPDSFSTFFTLNGLIACRLTLSATAGERVRLYGVSLGNEIDLHTLGISGHALTFRGKRQAGLSLIPGTMYAADTVAAGGGGWLLASSVIHHAERGMVARFTVAGGAASAAAPAAAPPSPAPGATLVDYYVAAREVEWDYAPAGTDMCVSQAFKDAAGDLFPPLPKESRTAADGTDLQGFPDSLRTFVNRGPASIGRRYLKARYLGFQTPAFQRPLGNAHNSSTGLLGPAMRAAPGDVLRILLRNNLKFPVNLAFTDAPLLLAYLRQRRVGDAAWGAALAGSPAELAALAVDPGWEAEAWWTVPASAGPGPADPPTIAWAYGSSVHPDHLYAGLAGGLIVGASAGALLPGAAAHGAAREYVLAWYIANENRSPYLKDNVARYAGNPASVDLGEEGFVESNLKHAVSGRLACNLGSLLAARGERVRLHLLGLGAELDMHTPQAHGNMLGVGVGSRGSASHVTALGVHPGTRATVELVARTAGQWLLECGVNDHWAAGMRALLQVVEPGGVPAGGGLYEVA